MIADKQTGAWQGAANSQANAEDAARDGTPAVKPLGARLEALSAPNEWDRKADFD
jgi:hypothetical protein